MIGYVIHREHTEFCSIMRYPTATTTPAWKSEAGERKIVNDTESLVSPNPVWLALTVSGYARDMPVPDSSPPIRVLGAI